MEMENATHTNRVILHREVTGGILGGALAVHTALGPGLLESAYRMCMARELEMRGLAVRQEVPVPIRFKGMDLDCGYRLDLLVADAVVVELKAVERLLPIHEAQVMTCMKLLDVRVGLLINFNTVHLRDGIRRLVI
jgi:GxxExxY protein